MDLRTAYWFIISLAVIPIPLLLFAWYRLRLLADGFNYLRIGTLTVASVSHAWLVLGLLFPSVWGESYSHIRFGIIDVNFALAVLCFVAAITGKRGIRVVLGTASLLTAVLWSIEAAINSSV